LVLALDTATVVSVGLARGGDVLGTATVPDRMAHVEQLVPLVRHVLADAGVRLAEVSALVVGLGPGPFTGLRVGIATARVFALVTGARLHGVCSLDVLAREHAGQHSGDPARGARGEFLAATDARRHELYWARYQASGRRIAGPFVGLPATLPPLPVVGPGAAVLSSEAGTAAEVTALSPAVMAAFGADLPSAGTEPLYLRRPDAAPPGRRKQVLLSSPEARSRPPR
jgi:tRNA threonylcarbamoyl adenosine modification protein YeaZ